MNTVKYILLLISVCFFLRAAGADFEAALELRRGAVHLGEYIQLVLHSDKRIDKIDYPAVPTAQWAKNIQSSSSRYINGKASFMKTLYLAPEKEGEYTIPPFKVYSGSSSVLTKSVKVRVLPRPDPVSEGGKSYKISDVLKGSITIFPRNRAIYAGEEMTLQCDLLVDERFSNQVRLSYYPQFSNVGNALFTTWDVRGGGKVRFRPEEPQQVVENNNTFIRYRFTALCRVLKPGAFDPGVSIRVGIVQRSSRREDPFDDFFGDMGGFFGSSRVENYTVEFRKAPAVEIRALPPVPAGAVSTSLVGQWQVSGVLSGTSLRQGEVCELILSFKGRGAAGDFQAPKVELPGFRVYPPEVSKNPGLVTAKYAMIPLALGEQVIKLLPCAFDPEKGKWQSTALEFKTVIAKGAVPAPAPVQKNFAAPVQKISQTPAAQEDTLFYQKSSSGSVVKVPLMANSLWLICFWGLVCPILAVGIELLFRRREKLERSPELQKKRVIAREIKGLMIELKKEGMTPELRSRLVPLLGEAAGLSAGASASELAEVMDSGELRTYFSRLDLAGFRPGGEAEEPELTPAARKELLKLLKKLSCIAVMLGIMCSAGAAGLNDKFNKGDFAGAAADYWNAARTSSGYRPDMLYNYGNACYRQNNLPEARWALTLAALLKPWDGEIRANLHLVNAQLFQNSSGTGDFSSALREMRDQIRYDHYLLLGAFFWGIFWLVWSFRRKLSKGVFYSIAAFLLFFCLLCCISCFAQKRSTFSPRRLIITANSVPLHSLPGREQGAPEAVLTGGSEGELIQYDNSGFARIRINGREGWVPTGTFKPLLGLEKM